MNVIKNVEYNKIRQALQESETINSRNEHIVPLYRLKEELNKRNVIEDDFKTYLYKYAPVTMHDYIEAVSKQLYHTDDEELDREEKFLITSGLC